VRVFLSQNVLEPTLREAAERCGARILFSSDCDSFEQDAGGVTASIRNRDTGETQRVRAQYLIAADGAHSRTREALGVRMLGHGVFSNSITIYFRANLRGLLDGRPWAVVYVNHPQLRGFFRFEKPFDSGFLVVNTLGDPARPDVNVAGLDADDALRLVQTALGSTDVPVTVDNVMRWQARADTAERFRSGRVFIAGDAAHVMPPTGGWGGNAGVQDADNLAWKLAMVLSGSAGSPLLETYDDERRPVGELTVEQAYTRYLLRTDPSIPRDGMQPIAGDMNVELGYVYRSAAVIAEEASEPALHLDPRLSRAMPGTRAPHYWLEKGGRQISTHDLNDRGFALLVAPQGGAWRDPAARVARDLRVPLAVLQPGHEGLADPAGGFASAFGIGPGGCVLVRPDGFVAWRAKDGRDVDAQGLGEAFTSVLCR
jgi:2-polyprenyl-6-methoxyphenol hydroxylase-like FAD-dependent oxidoreductase